MNYGGYHKQGAGTGTTVAPSEEEVWRIEDQFLFGDDFLVAPVLAPGLSGGSVYFPANSETWVHLVRSSWLRLSILVFCLLGCPYSFG